MTDQSIPAEAIPEVAPPAPRVSAKVRPFYWSVRREFWENRVLWIAPLSVAGGIAVAALISRSIDLRRNADAFVVLDGAHLTAELVMLYSVVAMATMATAFIVNLFYCLGALHNERRDRSILFWKSLPVSDLTTVLAKASVPMLGLPVIVFICVVATQLAMVLLHAALMLAHGLSPAPLWERLPLVRLWGVLAYGLIAGGIWYAPVYAWLLLVSAWAKRNPFLWAVLPPLVLSVFEKIAVGTNNLGNLIALRLGGGMGVAFKGANKGALDRIPDLDPLRFVGSLDVWVGLAVAAAFLAGAVWLRRYREPI